jgi:hypothetical protein
MATSLDFGHAELVPCSVLCRDEEDKGKNELETLSWFLMLNN